MDDKQKEELREVFHSGNTHAAKRTMLDMSADVRLRFIEAKESLNSEEYSQFLFIISCLLEEARVNYSAAEISKIDGFIAKKFNRRAKDGH